MTIQDRQSRPPAFRTTGVTTSVIVPTFNESPNIAEVVRRVISAVGHRTIEIVFVDDSTDDTPAAVLRAAEGARIPVRLIHRDNPVGGLSGAVLEGIAVSDSEWCVVMDGDLQHPPEMIPVLLDSALDSGADIVVASRYIGAGTNEGLSGRTRKAVSRGSILLAKTLFPLRLWDCSDPMTGFFAVRRRALDLTRLQPRGFKILLEILASHRLRVIEEGFSFGERRAGESKADLSQGAQFLRQLAALRLGLPARRPRSAARELAAPDSTPAFD